MRFPLKIFTFIGIAFIAIGTVGLAWLYQETDGFAQERSEFKHEKTIDAAAIQHISVKADYAEVVLLPGKDSDIHVSFQGSALNSMEKQVSFKAEAQPSDTAVIEALIHKKFQTGIDIPQLFDMINGNLRPKLEITVPDKMYRSLQVKGDIGSVRIEGLQAQTAKLSTDVGTLSVDGFKSDSFKASTDTGAMNIKDVSGAVELESGIGAIHLSLSEFSRDATVYSDIGGISVKLPRTDAMRVDIKSEIGASTVNLPDMVFTNNDNHNIQGTIGDKNKGPLLKIRSDIGGVSVGLR